MKLLCIKALNISSQFFWLAFGTIILCSLIPTAVYADGGAPNLAYVSGTPKGISIIDIGQQAITGTITLEGDPHTILLSLDGRNLYVSQPALGRVAVLATRTKKTICTASLSGRPELLALDTGSNVLYAAGLESATVWELDPTSCSIKHTFTMGGPVKGLGVAVTDPSNPAAESNPLLVTDATSLSIFTKEGQQRASIPISGGPQYLATPPGPVIYVSTHLGTVLALDITTHRLSSPLLAGGSFGPMDYDATSGEVYALDQRNNTINVLTPLSPGPGTPPHEPRRLIHLAALPESIAITSDGQLGFVAIHGGSVVILDIPGRQIVKAIPVGGSPHFIITGLYPPLIGSIAQPASQQTIINFVLFDLVVAAIVVPIFFFLFRKQKPR